MHTVLTLHELTLINVYFLCRSPVSYSDACGGQNCNHTIVGFLSELHRRGLFERIDHKYLERGHAYLECDTDFSQIEKERRAQRFPFLKIGPTSLNRQIYGSLLKL